MNSRFDDFWTLQGCRISGLTEPGARELWRIRDNMDARDVKAEALLDGIFEAEPQPTDCLGDARNCGADGRCYCAFCKGRSYEEIWPEAEGESEL